MTDTTPRQPDDVKQRTIDSRLSAHTSAEAKPDAGAEPPHAKTTVTVASLGFFLITLDISIVNVALASIRDELGGGTVAQQWVIDGYTLLFGALLLSAGNLADRIGAKRAVSFGITGFAFTSAVCAAAPAAWALIAARCAQGAAAAVMLPASMALIREAFPDPQRRARALGVWAVGGAVAALVGQPLGGLLTTLSWRWIFLINVPVCVGMLAFLRRVPASGTHPSKFDWAGQVLAVVALSTFIYGLIEGGHAGFATAPAITALVIAVASTAAFLVVQARGQHPMMPLELFRARGLRLALPVGFAFMVGNYGNVFVLSLFLQQQLGLAPLQAGLLFIPSAMFAIVANLASGPITNRFGPRLPIVVGQLLMVLGLLSLIAAASSRSPLLIAVCLIPVAGGALAMPPVTGVVLDGVPPARAGTASAVFNTFRQIGGAVAIAVFGALVSDGTTFFTGMNTSLIVAASLLFLTSLSSLLIRPVERRTQSN